ncbi:CocE/NonD family hydrolase [Novosphingobium pentaromativorans]|uniref:Xaa-Pro dipeptidyl-peptidase C-terminal domain-containing protein n=1 Tax=Novosphingobium pentaromativorans US6-1 TaxID=1088721 RepID=G6EG47_9SPHN|nr:CocE/NonD family hydrolase [Novosphingobium pentaromativorans]AIT82263.1 X-Pro dipeptidyl-peptidase [Novosphingobium pentaromativorans US6-1]EHJ59736.1 hypothetical protein NSU_3318 [Novosphingobium pentaromativorans US6-1]
MTLCSVNVANARDITEAETVRDIGYVTMADGTRIAYIAYHPRSGRIPSVFVYSPYTASASSFEDAKPFLDAGYAYVAADMTATGCSEGIVEHWISHTEGKHGAGVIEWIAKQPWSDGKVGMIGNSAAGSSQLWVAAERPPHLRAIVPAGVSDDYRHAAYQGGILTPGIIQWAFDTQYRTPSRGIAWRIEHGDSYCGEIRSNGRLIVKHPLVDEIRKHPLQDEWWDSVTPASPGVAGRINVPTMIITMTQDEVGAGAAESLEIFNQQMAGLKNKKLIMMNGSHGSASLGAEGYGLVDAERMRFLDRWVKGIRNGVDAEPPVTVYWDVRVPNGDARKAEAGWVTRHDAWPDPAVERMRYYLTPDGGISPDKPGVKADNGARLYLYPTGSEMVYDNQAFALQPNAAGVLNYRTEPMAADMTLLGNPSITFYISIDNGDDTDLQLILTDVDPDGKVLYLQSGLRRASFREIDAERSSADEVVAAYRRSEKLEPGKIYQVQMSLLGPVAHVVRKGHRLGLSVEATSATLRKAASGIPAGSVSINRVFHSDRYPSSIVLPILPGVGAGAPAPECGTLRNQPCRKETRFVPGGL